MQQHRARAKQRQECVGVFRGRRFTKASVGIIQRCVQHYFVHGRTRISIEVCKALRWRQPNGWLKDRACREVLRILHEKKIIALPPKISGHRSEGKEKASVRLPKPFFPQSEVHNELRIEWAKGNHLERTWNELVRNHHYRGHKVIVGRCIKYLIYLEDNIVGAIAFSSPAWKLSVRDAALKRIGINCKDIKNVIINNTRFLITPGPKVANLASRILAFTTARVARDWEGFYGIRPLVVETFVEPSRFQGTCYRAANWVYVGCTKGYCKHGSSHSNSQEAKYIFLYGLSSELRNRLQSVHSDQLLFHSDKFKGGKR